ncbi:SIMPL domain-containing protein [Candidatus Phycosocius spiralis]|uniref:SIMPL domain-containing protein n=1 Tax=Candidatus Phycosocius spiralis TaxID=2815099 RepID=A0ABQ4PWB9_9PROT|nr:SIMPL domain-containing protein [Candidatus Phycosocius spiralis]GIU67313.1 SIMPL domain-containing protein [Candidatus Phycosocius spiralis]
MRQLVRQSILLAFGFALLGWMPMRANAQAPQVMPPPPMMHPLSMVPPPTSTILSFSVSAEQKKAPDMATLSAGVVTLAKTAKAAMADNAQKMAAALNALKAAGLTDKDIQTSGIQLYPQYETVPSTRPRIIGYQVSNQVVIKVRNLDQIGPVLDTLIGLGINEISGPNFGLENAESVLNLARGEAMATAFRRADLYAKAAGLRVKRIVTIQEEGGGITPIGVTKVMSRAAFADSSPVTPVAPGEVSQSIELTVQIELEK